MGTTTAKTESCLLEQLQSRAASADVPARPPATSADAITSGMGGCAITSRVGGCAIRRAVGGCTRLVPAGAECWVSRRFKFAPGSRVLVIRSPSSIVPIVAG